MHVESLWQLITVKSAARTPVVLIDGGSGSGKTTLARDLAAAYSGCQLVSLDDFYPGWQGLADASAMVVHDVLGPRHGYRRWDWLRQQAAEWVDIDPELAMIVEGCGSLTPQSKQISTFAIWCELDEPTRKIRALTRDAGSFHEHWQEWARQEKTHWEKNHPADFADLVVRG